MSIAASITPSPESKVKRRKEKTTPSQKLGTTLKPSIKESNFTWRKHGKHFRTNIVLADEGDGRNMFALSDSCAIERYYRVADRYEAGVCFVLRSKRMKGSASHYFVF